MRSVNKSDGKQIPVIVHVYNCCSVSPYSLRFDHDPVAVMETREIVSRIRRKGIRAQFLTGGAGQLLTCFKVVCLCAISCVLSVSYFLLPDDNCVFCLARDPLRVQRDIFLEACSGPCERFRAILVFVPAAEAVSRSRRICRFLCGQVVIIFYEYRTCICSVAVRCLPINVFIEMDPVSINYTRVQFLVFCNRDRCFGDQFAAICFRPSLESACVSLWDNGPGRNVQSSFCSRRAVNGNCIYSNDTALIIQLLAEECDVVSCFDLGYNLDGLSLWNRALHSECQLLSRCFA